MILELMLQLALASGEPTEITAAPTGGSTETSPAAPVETAAAKTVEEPPAEKTPDESISRYRTPFETLTERMLGTASKPVRFDWRKTTLGVGGTFAQLVELNNFGSIRSGAVLRFPLGSLLGEVGLTRAWAWGTDSTDKLARTPYRQIGRPTRVEIDFNLSLPLAEGVVTSMPGFFPATQLVFSGTGGLRYMYYPGALSGASFSQYARGLLSPRLTDRELEHLAEERPAGMQVDLGRYALLAGVTTDLYFQSGFFVSPRALFSVPLLVGATGSQLYLWWELTLTLGLAF